MTTVFYLFELNTFFCDMYETTNEVF